MTSWNAGAEWIKGYVAAEIIGQHFERFYTDEERAAGAPARTGTARALRAASKPRAGGSARTVARFWAHVIIDPIRNGRPAGGLRQDHPRSFRATRRPRKRSGSARSSFGCWCRASPTTPSSCSTATAASPTGTRAPSASRAIRPDEIIGQHFSRFYTEEDRARRAAGAGASNGRRARAAGRARAGGCARTAAVFWAHVVIDPIRDQQGELIGLCQGHARHHRAQGGAGRRLEQAREALFQSQKMEARRPAHRRHRARFQQSADGGAGLAGAAAQASALRSAPSCAAGQRHAGRPARRDADPAHAGLRAAPGDGSRTGRCHRADRAACASFLQRAIGPAYRVEMRFPPGLPLVMTDPAQLELALLNLCRQCPRRHAGPRRDHRVAAAREL